jgi:hypothetical protein
MVIDISRGHTSQMMVHSGHATAVSRVGTDACSRRTKRTNGHKTNFRADDRVITGGVIFILDENYRFN